MLGALGPGSLEGPFPAGPVGCIFEWMGKGEAFCPEPWLLLFCWSSSLSLRPPALLCLLSFPGHLLHSLCSSLFNFSCCGLPTIPSTSPSCTAAKESLGRLPL